MKKIMAIGEALIDFIPSQNGSYMPHLGGAPCNVAGAYVKLGGQATLLTQLGDDLFGQRIRKELIEKYGEERGSKIRYAEAYMFCEYGAPLNEENRKKFERISLKKKFKYSSER